MQRRAFVHRATLSAVLLVHTGEIFALVCLFVRNGEKGDHSPEALHGVPFSPLAHIHSRLADRLTHM